MPLNGVLLYNSSTSSGVDFSGCYNNWVIIVAVGTVLNPVFDGLLIFLIFWRTVFDLSGDTGQASGGDSEIGVWKGFPFIKMSKTLVVTNAECYTGDYVFLGKKVVVFTGRSTWFFRESSQ